MKVNISSAALRRKYQQGLTLIELLVVLFILAAVAGVAIGIVPNVQKRTHGATSAASIRAGESALTAELFTGGLLNGGFDGLVNAGGTAIPDYVGETAAEGFQLVTLDAAQADALQDLGIDEVHPAAADSLALNPSHTAGITTKPGSANRARRRSGAEIEAVMGESFRGGRPGEPMSRR